MKAVVPIGFQYIHQHPGYILLFSRLEQIDIIFRQVFSFVFGAKGFMKPGNMVYIYDYSLKPLKYNDVSFAKPPYSLHFFPGLKKLYVKGHGK